MPPAPTTFSLFDWFIVAAYFAIVVSVGVLVSRRKPSGDEMLLAGRGMPGWAVMISVLATAQSAATFIGAPEQGYSGNLTYLLAHLATVIATIIVALIFIPAFYRAKVTSVYELLGLRFGGPARVSASAMFMIGRVFASGARLFMIAIPFALIAFGNIEPGSLIVSIVVIALVAALYTSIGGIRAVIWTDVLQAVVVLSAVVFGLVMLIRLIPADFGTVIEALRTEPSGSKLIAVDLSFDLSRPFTLWTILGGVMLLNLAAFGTDQDLAQRMLTCKSAKASAWSVIGSSLLGWPIVALFMVIGLLLYIYYQRPDVMGDAAPLYVVDDSRKVFLEFMLHELPSGARGLMMAGLFAAAMSSMDSALNAMSSTVVADFYRPRKRKRTQCDPTPSEERRVTRLAIVGWAVALAGFACGCVFWQQASGQNLINFALGVMVFAYAGLLGVFLTALLTKRGNAMSAVCALAVGFVAVTAMQGGVWEHWAVPMGLPVKLAFAWKMLAATALSFSVCCVGKRQPPSLALNI